MIVTRRAFKRLEAGAVGSGEGCDFLALPLAKSANFASCKNDCPFSFLPISLPSLHQLLAWRRTRAWRCTRCFALMYVPFFPLSLSFPPLLTSMLCRDTYFPEEEGEETGLGDAQVDESGAFALNTGLQAPQGGFQFVRCLLFTRSILLSLAPSSALQLTLLRFCRAPCSKSTSTPPRLSASAPPTRQHRPFHFVFRRHLSCAFPLFTPSFRLSTRYPSFSLPLYLYVVCVVVLPPLTLPSSYSLLVSRMVHSLLLSHR
jgi:hypothetical protein